MRGRTVRDVEAAPPRDSIFVIGAAGESPFFVLFSADPDAPRAHVLRAKGRAHDGPVGPFFRTLQSEASGAIVRDLASIGGDRVLRIELETPLGRRALVLELFGRQANAVWLDRDDKILAVLAPPRPDELAPRLAVGALWRPLPSRRSAEAETTSLIASFPAAPNPEPGTRGLATGSAPLSWIVECSLGEQALAARRARASRTLIDRVNRKLSRAKSLLDGLTKKQAESAGAERVQQDGELLKAHLADVRRGAKEIEVEDFFAPDTPLRVIALDPKLGPKENLMRIFERAKKLERGRLSVESEISRARARIEALDALLAAAAEPQSDPETLDARAVKAGLLDPPQDSAPPERRKEAAPRLPYRVFVASGGSQIRVGRNARDNDELTFRHARGNDMWLHTSDAPGSHVVLRVEKNAEPSAEEILDAAHLAVHFSPMRGRGGAGVHVARQKDVHKPRGAKAGLVTLSGGKVLRVRIEPDRLARLLGDDRAAGT